MFSTVLAESHIARTKKKTRSGKTEEIKIMYEYVQDTYHSWKLRGSVAMRR